MKQEFISSNGKVVIERDNLYFKNIKTPLDETAFWKILLLAAPLLLFIMNLMRDNPRGYAGAVLWGFLFVLRLPDLYEFLFQSSYASRIQLRNIVGVEVIPDTAGLEVYLKIQLKSGRYRKIIFRKLEGQYEPLVELIYQRMAQPSFA
jgi:hypothetical protein